MTTIEKIIKVSKTNDFLDFIHGSNYTTETKPDGVLVRLHNRQSYFFDYDTYAI